MGPAWILTLGLLTAYCAGCGAEEPRTPRPPAEPTAAPRPATESPEPAPTVTAEATTSPAEPPPAPQAPRTAAARPAFTRYARLAPPTHGDLPDGAPSFAVHAPAGFDPTQPFAVVVFLHGWSGCVRALVEGEDVPCAPGDAPRQGWGLGRVHDAAETNSLLVVPQLRYLARSGAAGRYREAGTFLSLVEAALRLAHDGDVDRAPGPDDAASIVLVAHSAGFETALAVLEARDLDDRIDGVLLLDALYRGSDGFAHWVASAPDRRLLSLYTGDQSTYQESRRLARLVRGRLGDAAVTLDPADVEAAIRARPRVVVSSTRIPHGAIPRLSLPALLRAWGLPSAPTAPILAR